jgi:hypothetical protein
MILFVRVKEEFFIALYAGVSFYGKIYNNIYTTITFFLSRGDNKNGTRGEKDGGEDTEIFTMFTFIIYYKNLCYKIMERTRYLAHSC